MEIPFRALSPETLRALIEEFVTRDGTDYGDQEVGIDAKVTQVERQLEAGRIKIVFDEESESCDIREA